MTDRMFDAVLRRGSGVAGGKERIAQYFEAVRSPKERAAFLKQEYGIGGMGFLGLTEDHDAKGLRVRLGCLGDSVEDMTYTWAEVASRIGELIDKGEYMTAPSPVDEHYMRLAASIYN